MKKRMFFMLVAVALVAAGIIGMKVYINGMIKSSIAASFSPPTVSTVKAGYQDWQPMLKAVGTLRAVNGSDLSSEVAGIVDTIGFESGTDVEKDTVLIQLRADDDRAKLRALEAALKLAEVNFDRDQKQIKVQAISQASVDSDAATLESARAQLAEQKAILDKKTIRAPFAGHLGIRLIDVGQYLNSGTPIVTLQQLDPIYVDFMLPEQALAKIVADQKVTLRTDATPDQDLTGSITAINSKVDEATRNVSVRAMFPNPEHKLLPGMFGTVIVNVDKPARYITLPQAALVFNTYGDTVYLVKKSPSPDGPPLTAQQVVVITGETRGDQVAVLSGIAEGDEVVTSGQVKLRSGMPVTINDDVQPSSDPNPSPHEH